MCECPLVDQFGDSSLSAARVTGVTQCADKGLGSCHFPYLTSPHLYSPSHFLKQYGARVTRLHEAITRVEDPAQLRLDQEFHSFQLE